MGNMVSLSKEQIYDLLIVQGLSSTEAGKILGVGRSKVLNWAHKYNIEVPQCGGRNYKDYANQKFNHLTLLEKDALKSTRSSTYWICKCDCGKQISIYINSVTTGVTKSCGRCKYRATYKGFETLSGVCWAKIKKGAEIRNLDFNITIEEAWELFIKQDKKCALSGLPITLLTNSCSNWKEHTASLDRIDNDKGYILGNVQWVHKDINMMRRVLTVQYFKELCIAVAKHNGEING